MKNNEQIALAILWIARVWAVLSIAFLLFMIGGHIFGSEPQNLNGWRDFVAMVFFPAGVLIGLIVALKSAKIGGIITIGSMCVFYLLRPDTLSSLWFYLIAAPGFLFLIYGFFFTKQLKTA